MAPPRIVVDVLRSEASVSTSIRIAAPGGWLLVDTGDGAAAGIASRRLDPRSLAGVVFTHGHPDHVGGLYAVLARLRSAGRREPLPLRMPRGCPEPGLLVSAWRRRYPPARGFAVRPRPFDPGRPIVLGPFRVRPFGVSHTGSLPKGGHGLLPAVGVEIVVGGRRIVISGDTGPCSALEREADGADLALVEATFARSGAGRRALHLSVAQARRVGSRAREYRLYHLGPSSRALLRPGEEATRVTLACR